MAIRDMAAVNIARRRLCSVMRAKSPCTLGLLPFDPADERDVDIWVWEQLRAHKWSDSETASYVAQRIVWDARNLVRRRLCSELSGFDIEVIADSRIESRPYRFAESTCSDDEVLEAMLCSVMKAVGVVFGVGSSCTARSGSAALSCLARIAHVVKDQVSERAFESFVAQLVEHPMFSMLTITQELRQRFHTSLLLMVNSGNIRRDLADVGLSCPGNSQWAAFSSVAEEQWKLEYDR